MAPQILDRVQNTHIINIPQESCMQTMTTNQNNIPKTKTNTKYSCATSENPQTPSPPQTSKHNSKTSTPTSSCQQTPTNEPTQKSSRITQALCSNICSYKKLSFVLAFALGCFVGYLLYKETRQIPPGYPENSRSIPKTTTPVLDSGFIRGVLNPFFDKVKERVSDEQAMSHDLSRLGDLGIQLENVDLASGVDWVNWGLGNDDDLDDLDDLDS